MDFIPERSELQVENIDVKDPVVKQMIKDLGLRKLVPGLNRKKGGEQWKLKHQEELFVHACMPLAAVAAALLFSL